MRQFVDAVRNAVKEKNWYGALAVALTMPDIAGRLETPGVGSQKRYTAWCDRYLTPIYTAEIGPNRTSHVFLGGTDCYALRCAYLHQGEDSTIDQRSREALDRFEFVTTSFDAAVHCNQNAGHLQLQIDIFCEDLCLACEQWMQDMTEKADVQQRILGLMKIEHLDIRNGFSL